MSWLRSMHVHTCFFCPCTCCPWTCFQSLCNMVGRWQQLQHSKRQHTCQIVDALLPFFHALNVGVQPNLLAARLAGLKAQQLGQALPVLGVFNDTQFDGLAKLLPEGGVLLGLCLSCSVTLCRRRKPVGEDWGVAASHATYTTCPSSFFDTAELDGFWETSASAFSI